MTDATMNDSSCGNQASSSSMELVKGIHQYYRDCLSQPASFPDLGGYPPELIQWVTDRCTTDVVQLAEFLEAAPRSTLPANQDMALRLMLFTIVHANLASDYSNRFPGYTLPANLVADIKKGLGRVLELHPTGDYIAICVQLLYRIKEIEEVLHLAENYPDVIAKYPILHALVGLVHTMLGNYEVALGYLAPLADDETKRNLPLVGLSFMTCQYRLGISPEWPLSFRSFGAAPDDLEDLIGRLPPLEMLQPLAKPTKPVVFVPCDTRYFYEHALYLVYSIYEQNQGALDLHLHLFSPEPRVLAEIERLRTRLPGMAIGVSVEFGPIPLPHPPNYYVTARFVRAYQVLRHYRCELCIIDADAVFNKGWTSFTAQLAPGAELALVRPAAAPFWEQILGGFVFCRPTPFAEQFLGKVAHFIAQNIELKKAGWFTDEIALAACDEMFAADNPAVAYLAPEVVVDTAHGPDSVCWMVTTNKTGNLAYEAARARLAEQYSA